MKLASFILVLLSPPIASSLVGQESTAAVKELIAQEQHAEETVAATSSLPRELAVFTRLVSQARYFGIQHSSGDEEWNDIITHGVDVLSATSNQGKNAKDYARLMASVGINCVAEQDAQRGSLSINAPKGQSDEVSVFRLIPGIDQGVVHWARHKLKVQATEIGNLGGQSERVVELGGSRGNVLVPCLIQRGGGDQVGFVKTRPYVSSRVGKSSDVRSVTIADMVCLASAIGVLSAPNALDEAWLMHEFELLCVDPLPNSDLSQLWATEKVATRTADPQLLLHALNDSAHKPEISFTMQRDGQSVMVTGSNGNPGLGVRDSIQRIQGVDCADILRAAKHSAWQGAGATREWTIWSKLIGVADSELTIDYTNVFGRNHESRIRCSLPFWKAFDRPLAFARLDHGLLYIDATAPLADRFTDVDKELARASGLIIDLRGSVGEVTTMWLRSGILPLGHINRTAEIPSIGAFAPLGGELVSFEIDSGSVSGFGAFGGKLAVLVDWRTCGAGERLAGDIARIGKVLLVGDSTAGNRALHSILRLPSGMTALFSVGKVLDADGRDQSRASVNPVPVDTRAYEGRSIDALIVFAGDNILND